VLNTGFDRLEFDLHRQNSNFVKALETAGAGASVEAGDADSRA